MTTRQTVLFRFVDKEGTPTGYVGIAFARDKEELFWTIDEFGNPFSVEVADLKQAGICIKCDVTLDENEGGTFDFSEVELTERFVDSFIPPNTYKWKKADWSSLPNYPKDFF